jgi:inner membrane protein
MTSPNHIVGGIAITGISLSFWDINIFQKPSFLVVAIFASLLPDIDHTKSIIGKIFFPIAKYLDKNFGHRTITHSLTFLVPSVFVVAFIERGLVSTDLTYTYVYFFGVLSHLILDMLTVQGIPLFYPFMRNPCVIPANPSYRIRSGNIKSEAIAMALFTMVLMSSFDLFQNGFWTSYNRSFGTITHAFREFKSSENIVSASFQYSFNGKEISSSGYIIDATENYIEFWDNTGIEPRIVKIDKQDNRFKNIQIQPVKTKFKYQVLDLNLFNVTLQQINDTLDNNIVSGKILSTGKFIVNNHRADKGSIELSKEISPKFQWIKDNKNQLEIQNKIKIKQSKLSEIQAYNFERKGELQGIKNWLFQLELNLKNSTDLYNKNKYEKLIIEQKQKLGKFTLNLKPTQLVVSEINALKAELNQNEKHYFSADLKLFQVPKDDNDFVVSNQASLAPTSQAR